MRTATTNLTQAGHAIKGLTGIDIPQVFNNALENADLTGSSRERTIRSWNEPLPVAEAESASAADSQRPPNEDAGRPPSA